MGGRKGAGSSSSVGKEILAWGGGGGGGLGGGGGGVGGVSDVTRGTPIEYKEKLQGCRIQGGMEKKTGGREGGPRRAMERLRGKLARVNAPTELCAKGEGK